MRYNIRLRTTLEDADLTKLVVWTMAQTAVEEVALVDVQTELRFTLGVEASSLEDAKRKALEAVSAAMEFHSWAVE